MTAAVVWRQCGRLVALRQWFSVLQCDGRVSVSFPGSRAGSSRGSSGTHSKVPDATSTTLPDVLWVPGATASDMQVGRLVGKIGMLCRDSQRCVVGARGELCAARAIRSLAKATEASKAAIEVRVRWHDDPGDTRSLRFHSEMRYSLREFRSFWDSLGLSASQSRAEVVDPDSNDIHGASAAPAATTNRFSVTPHTVPQSLATAVASEVRKQGRVALVLNASSDSVLNAAAKALASIPHVSRPEGCNVKPMHLPAEAEEAAAVEVTERMRLRELGPSDLVCVLRWPQSRGATRIYAHLFHRHV